MRKFLITIIVLLVLGVLGYFGFQALQARRQANSISSLQTVSATQGDLTATIGATGTVRPDQTALLSWKTSGTVDQVFVNPGQVITAGQTLQLLPNHHYLRISFWLNPT